MWTSARRTRLNNFDVNNSPLVSSNVTTPSGHRGVGVVVNDKTRFPPRSRPSPDLIVRSRARKPPRFHAAASASEDAGVPGLSAA